MTRVLLISTYELGRQPFALASPAAWLAELDGVCVRCMDLAVEEADGEALRAADVVAVHLPMHTATRLAVPLLRRVSELNPEAMLCAYGLYAPVNAELLRDLGVDQVLGVEFEERLQGLVADVASDRATPGDARDGDSHGDGRRSGVGIGDVDTTLPRLQFRVPERGGLPSLERYAQLAMPDGSHRVVGYTEATRGCKHSCRHCPVVPAYDGLFRVVQPDVVLEDVRRQVAAGAEHITFGDPDFLNGPRHAEKIVERLHAEFPDLTFDVTAKVDHLLEQRDLLPLLRDAGCAFVTSAVESLDDEVLELLDKGHTRAQFLELVELTRDVGLVLQPTFVAFHPWTTWESHAELLHTLDRLDLVDNVPPIQLALRLLIPSGSRLLELPEVARRVGPFDRQALVHPWEHDDPAIDALQRDLEQLVERLAPERGRREVFAAVCRRFAERCADAGVAVPGRWMESIAEAAVGVSGAPAAVSGRAGGVPGSGCDDPQPARCTVPYLTEPWYC